MAMQWGCNEVSAPWLAGKSPSNSSIIFPAAMYGESSLWKGLPGLVNIQKTMENHHFFIGKSTISMTIFNSC